MKSVHTFRYRIQGLSLVELMVALTIGLVILAAVSSLFVSTKQTYTTQDSLARLQENARFAMQFLIRDIRLAGYYGCLGTVDPGPPTANSDTSIGSSNFKFNLKGAPSFFTNAFIPVEGVENASGTWLPSGAALPTGLVTGTDAIAIRTVDTTAVAVVAPGMLNGSATLNVDNASPFAQHDIVVVSDCAVADIFQVTDVSGNALQHSTTGSTPGNQVLGLKKAYEPPARVYKMVTRQYFIRQNAAGVPSLYRQDGASAAVELVEGIESLQILYGEDTDTVPDGIPNRYRSASAVTDWTKVMSVRIGILARTINDKDTDTDNENHDVDGDGTDEVTAPGDHFRRRIFQAVVQLRNT